MNECMSIVILFQVDEIIREAAPSMALSQVSTTNFFKIHYTCNILLYVCMYACMHVCIYITQVGDVAAGAFASDTRTSQNSCNLT